MGFKPHASLLTLWVLLATGTAYARQRAPRIWDVTPGMHVSELPAREFVEPACGNNGGPRGALIGSFTQFSKCPANADGLHEIWFEYDDTAEFVALARRQPGRTRTTSVLDQPVVVSLLIDSAGVVRGYRIFTDTRAEHDLRLHAHEVALHFRARFDLEGHCKELPAANGETPIDGQFVKELCQKESDGRRITSEARFYYRPGQQFRDPNTGAPMVNAFESWARLEVMQIERSAPANASQLKQSSSAASFTSQRAAFLAGASNDCPGCALGEADLRYRDLSGANLRGANLQDAQLHRAALRGADLTGARLVGANLNRASLVDAKLQGASLDAAMLYQADAQNADLAGANLTRALMGRTTFTFANFERATLNGADLGDARLNDANLTGAALNGAQLQLATLARARLKDVIAEGANFADARLRGADLKGAMLRGAYFSQADLAGANLGDADFTSARLVSADLTGAQTQGALFSQTLMPDNSLRP